MTRNVMGRPGEQRWPNALAFHIRATIFEVAGD
jgi:hypothetical protein